MIKVVSHAPQRRLGGLDRGAVFMFCGTPYLLLIDPCGTCIDVWNFNTQMVDQMSESDCVFVVKDPQLHIT